MTNGQKIMTAVLGGAVLGLVTGILVAPYKGSDTRKHIVDAATKATDKVKEFADNTSETIKGFKKNLLLKKDEVFQGDESSLG